MGTISMYYQLTKYRNNWFWDPSLSDVVLDQGACVLVLKNLKWSTLLVYGTLFCHFKPFYRHDHSKCHFPGPGRLDLNAFKTFVFCFLKIRCAHVFSVLAPGEVPKFLSFLSYSKFRILKSWVSWRHQMPKHEINAF